ncbi:hypothetical protein J2T41_000438 [Pseudomonas citronellolis]|uniref:hypothetical protein n=1 Tax=Pseudomonas citronellolis TaxID=53408 RepID=UPI00209CB8F8|nr:hypothetical protein [Pseudomonas citronellolis]MCP1640844.1 hypothetical protein [Pseudomonas citronellolis]MCP1663762.1 hypothetical protein [Pseudomonas citronellolis]MCP1696940.1 hypothetical protein [Pseudomonas citronellolis]MCP1701426.1 hypothetical protein [Pseudomonas citronellolis]MCP1795549.1 hypothetical protein [Pseudomonas citronellolis]
MIDFYSWHPYLRIACLLSPFVILLSGAAVLAYTTHRHYERILTAFPNNPGVNNYNRIWAGSSFRSRCMQVASTAGFMFLLTRINIRRGHLSPEDLRNFPPDIRRLMLISGSLLLAGSAWLFLLVGLLKLSGVK